MPRKKFKETKVGIFLKEKTPEIFEGVKDALPDKGVIGFVKNLIDTDEKMPQVDKDEALRLLKMAEIEYQYEQEITKRWEADMNSDSWLSKNSRPLVLLSMVLMLFIFIFCDSFKIQFDIKESWISLYETVLITVIIAYFGSRGVEKFQASRNKKSVSL